MKLLRSIPVWLRNKYMISFVAFVVWMLFFDHNDLPTQFSRYAKLKELEQSARYYNGEIAGIREQLRLMESDPSWAEKLAREKYFMKRDNEDLFVIK